MATLLISPAHRHGILLNPSPAASPQYHLSALPALVPSNSSLSSSASSSTPGDSSDYFSSKSPSPDPPKPSAPRRDSGLIDSTSKQRNDSNQSTVRRIRFAPLPEPRRDQEDENAFPPVFDDEESDPHPEPQLTMFSALAAASMSLAIHPDSDVYKRLNGICTNISSSPPCPARKSLPRDSLLLDHSCPPSSTESSDPAPPDTQHSSVPSDSGQDSENLPPSPTAPHHSLFHHQSVPLLHQSPRKSKGIFNVFSRLRNARSSHSSLAHTFSAAETASINGDAHRGRSTGHFFGGSRNSSVSREGSLTRREPDFGTPLQRWTSESASAAGLPVSKKKRHHLFFGGHSNSGSSSTGVPLGRTQSLTSLSSRDEKKAGTAAKAKPAPPPSSGPRGRKQQRLLNGRVYGAKRDPPANPFANARPAEPEFVEWGYGGMGSVKSSVGQNSIWARVQARDDASGLNAADEEDASGMAYVRRRREAKEREAREKAEAEAKAERGEGEDHAPDASETANKAEESKNEGEDRSDLQGEAEERMDDRADAQTAAENAPAGADANATVTSTPAPGTPLASEVGKTHQLEHITQAITIPAPFPHPHSRHHHSHSIGYSHAMYPAHQAGHPHRFSLTMPFEIGETAHESAMAPVAVSSGLEENAPSVSVPTPSRLRTESSTDTEERESVSSSGASAMSTMSDDADDGDCEESPKDAFGQDEEDDEEDEEMERSRVTAVSAGVEKIARHHKDEHSTGGTPAAEVPT